MHAATRVLGILACLVAIPATAGIIYDNGGPDGSNTWFSDLAVGIFQFDDFVLEPGANIITDIHWYGGYLAQAPEFDDFLFLIIDEPGGTVFLYTAAPNVTRVSTEVIGQDGLLIYEYWSYIDPLVLDAGVTYWLSIINNTSDSIIWGWSTAGAGVHLMDERGDISLQDQNLAFRLTNDVIPEPATLGLVGLGLIGMAARFRKRAR
jgi:hypothetical protein